MSSRYHPWRWDSIHWTYERLPEEEKPQLARAIATLDAAIAGEEIEPMLLDAAIDRILAVATRHRPEFR